MSNFTKVVAACGLAGSTFGLASPAMAASSSTTLNSYEHGVYSQEHFSSQSDCIAARKAASIAVVKWGGVNVSSGICHEVSLNSSMNPTTTWMYDIRYDRPLSIWMSDTKLGTSSADVYAGSHSFARTGSYSTQAQAVNAYNAAISNMKSGVGVKITATSPVTYNQTSKAWLWEIDYSSRGALSATDIEFNEKAGATRPSIVGSPTSVSTTKGSTTTTTTTATGVNSTVTTKSSSNNNGSVTTTVTTKTPTQTTSTTRNQVGTQGIDISGYNTNSDWSGWSSAGDKFVYIKATQGTYYKNPLFSQQYSGATNAGFIRGAYDFADPANTSGTSEATYFVNNGGGWSNDGKTLPGAVDLEWNPSGDMCYNKTPTQMQQYITDYENTYHSKTGVYASIYTASIWWNKCVGNMNLSTISGSNSSIPLWIANYGTSTGTLPVTWSGTSQMIWQNSDGTASGFETVPVGAAKVSGFDTDIFNGSLSDLKQYAVTGSF